jgi:catechol 2,3-dioxygenase-like lactoylglutathione lyase family enzyme
MTFSFDCIFYFVSDLDHSIAFYTDVLGLRLVSRDVVARLEIDGIMIELVPARDPEMIQGQGNGRLCLKTDDTSQAVGRLRELGVAVEPTQEVQNGFITSFRDPDGNELCLWQYRATS